MLDRDLASPYGVTTKVLNQAVRRNAERFPQDFMFQLSEIEEKNLRSQIVTSSLNYGGRRYNAHAFTEFGIAMLSSVEIERNTAIMFKVVFDKFEKLEKASPTLPPQRRKIGF